MILEPSEAAVTAWTHLLRAQQTAMGSIDLSLKRAGFPPLAWYDVLLELDRGPEAGMRPFALERRLLLPQYGLSRLIGRIEAAGYVERRPFEGDGRGQVILITQAGRALRRQIWPVYADGIKQAVGDKLSDAEARTLAMLLAKLTVS